MNTKTAKHPKDCTCQFYHANKPHEYTCGLNLAQREKEKPMRAKHTPGPWTVGKKHGQVIDIDTKEEKRLGYSSWSGMAQVYGSNEEPLKGTEVMEANAALIAAAPELFEACKEVLRRNMVIDGHELLERAISKATKGV